MFGASLADAHRSGCHDGTAAHRTPVHTCAEIRATSTSAVIGRCRVKTDLNQNAQNHRGFLPALLWVRSLAGPPEPAGREEAALRRSLGRRA
jgi:hypothetical protein